jgi:hypothetical protein
LSKSYESIPLGFHEFFRYAIPGYGFVAVAIIVFLLIDINGFSLSLSNAVLSAITGPFIGFLVSVLYYQIWMRHYKHNSKAYKKVNEIIKSIPKFRESELGTEYKDDQLTLVRCVWDFVYFSKNNEATRDRIQFTFTMMHSIGATILAIWMGFFSGLASPFFLGYVEFSNIDWRWAPLLKLGLLAWVLLVISLLLYLAFRERKILGENEEYLFVRENQEKIKEKVSSNMNTPRSSSS